MCNKDNILAEFNNKFHELIKEAVECSERIIKITYSEAFENLISEQYRFLKKDVNIYTLDDVKSNFNDVNLYSKNSDKLQYISGIMKNFIGLIPIIGIFFTLGVIAKDSFDLYISRSDIKKLKGKINLKNKPKKYKKVKYVLFIKNTYLLSIDETKYLVFDT